jgi:hypothetical protein
MPRTESYLLRLTKSEKDELAQRAKLQGVSIAKLIRQKLNLDAEPTLAEEREERLANAPGPFAGSADIPPRPTSKTVAEVRADFAAAVDQDSFDRLVAHHKLRYSTATAERMARKELYAE